MKPQNFCLVLLLSLPSVALLSGCASSGDTFGGATYGNNQGSAGGNRIESCKTTDRLIDSSTQCLQDDAACYQLSNGQWCTGERGSVCPAGSVAVPAGQSCAIGRRCFQVSESLICTIN